MRYSHAPRAIALLLATSLFAACSDNSLLLPVRTKSPANRSADAQEISPFHDNSVKYSDKGAKPASGRSGSASIEGRALLAMDASTTIEASTGQLDGAPPPGTISKVQLKSLNGYGDAIRTVNFNRLADGGHWSTVTQGLLHGAPLQIQANVRGIDADRTDVVTVTATVKKRPDIRVDAITNPAKAYVNTAVHVSALLSEINGDVGARTDCVLLVDGVQVDQALGVWVDAGDGVSCAFLHTFATTGTHLLGVRAVNVIPGDWDTSNNQATTSIEIVLPIVNLSWHSTAFTGDRTYFDDYTDTYDGCLYYYACVLSYGTGTIRYNHRSVAFTFDAQTNQAAAVFPATVAFSATSNGAPIAATNGTIGTVGDDCAATYDSHTFTWSRVCASGSSTSLAIRRYAGTITNYSQQYVRIYFRQPIYCSSWGRYYLCGFSFSGPDVYQYTYNQNDGNPSALFSLGSDVAVSVVLTDAAGERFLAGGSYAVTGHDSDVTTPFHYSSGNFFYSYDQMGTIRLVYHVRAGSGSGFGQQ